MCVKAGKALVTGDTLFVNECGRVDLAGSDPDAMFRTIRKLAALPDDTVVYPGHDYGKTPTSTIGEQRRTSPCMQPATLEAFRAWLAEP
jgi:glyoxylase-like metal-dependent hydrolase (beta-lactamase superfamily II)